MSDNGSNSALVAIVAIIVIAAVGFFAYQTLMNPAQDSDDTSINVDIPSGDDSMMEDDAMMNDDAMMEQ